MVHNRHLYAARIPLVAMSLLVILRLASAESNMTPMMTMSGAEVTTDAAESWMHVYHVRPGVDYVYEPMTVSRFLTMVPDNVVRYSRVTFRKNNLLPIVAMAAGTGILIAVDQPIDDAAKHVARHWGLHPTEHQKSILRPSVKINGQVLKLYINVPSDANTAVYFLGDGIVHLGTAAGFGVYGGITHDHRALQTCTQLVEAIASTGFVVQVLKHVTGRETPAKHTAPGGKWRFFPSPADYGRNVPKYDAWPTGHLATAMATVTVIADNYPEWKLARPVGYTLMAACGFAMLNNGVHWASDYPFGISLGYTMAKLAETTGRLVVHNRPNSGTDERSPARSNLSLQPELMGSAIGYGLTYRW